MQRKAAEAARQRQKLEHEVAPMGVRFKSLVGSKPARWGQSTTQASGLQLESFRQSYQAAHGGSAMHESLSANSLSLDGASLGHAGEAMGQVCGASCDDAACAAPAFRSLGSSEEELRPTSLGCQESAAPREIETEEPPCAAQCDTEMRDVNDDLGGGVVVDEPMSISQQEAVTNPNPPQGDAVALAAPEETPAVQVQRFRRYEYYANSNLVLLTDPAPNSSRPRCDEAAAAATKAAEPSAKRTKRESWLETMAAAHASSGLSGALAAFDAHLATSDAAVAAQPSTYITASEVLHECGVDGAVCADLLFNVLETKLPDAQVCRVVAYHLLSYGCFDDAVALLELVRETLAPAEPHSFTDLAFARFHRLRAKSSDCGLQTSAAHTRCEMAKVVADLTTVLAGTEWPQRFREIEWPVLILLSWAVAWAEHKLAELASLWPEEQLPAATYRLGGAVGPQLDVFVWLGWDTDHTVRFRPRPAPPRPAPPRPQNPAALTYAHLFRFCARRAFPSPLADRRMWTCTSRSRRAKRYSTRTITRAPPVPTSRATSPAGTAPKSTRCRARPRALTVLRPTTTRRTRARARPAPRRPSCGRSPTWAASRPRRSSSRRCAWVRTSSANRCSPSSAERGREKEARARGTAAPSALRSRRSTPVLDWFRERGISNENGNALEMSVLLSRGGGRAVVCVCRCGPSKTYTSVELKRAYYMALSSVRDSWSTKNEYSPGARAQGSRCLCPSPCGARMCEPCTSHVRLRDK